MKCRVCAKSPILKLEPAKNSQDCLSLLTSSEFHRADARAGCLGPSSQIMHSCNSYSEGREAGRLNAQGKLGQQRDSVSKRKSKQRKKHHNRHQYGNRCHTQSNVESRERLLKPRVMEQQETELAIKPTENPRCIWVSKK